MTPQAFQEQVFGIVLGFGMMGGAALVVAGVAYIAIDWWYGRGGEW